MPSASNEQRAEWGTDGGAGEEKAINYLRGRGWVLSGPPFAWIWIPPTKSHTPDSQEIGAIQFLIDEWDFGGYIRENEITDVVREALRTKYSLKT